MVKLGTGKNKKVGIRMMGIAFLMLLSAMITFVLLNGKETKELKISGTRDVGGLKCENSTRMSFIIRDVQPISYGNTIIANFADNVLSSISYTYEGGYSNSAEADRARSLTEAKYNLTVTEDIGLDLTTFARNMAVSENSLYITVTASGVENLNAKTAPIFMLESGKSFPTALSDMKTAYESIGFNCEVNK